MCGGCGLVNADTVEPPIKDTLCIKYTFRCINLIVTRHLVAER